MLKWARGLSNPSCRYRQVLVKKLCVPHLTKRVGALCHSHLGLQTKRGSLLYKEQSNDKQDAIPGTTKVSVTHSLSKQFSTVASLPIC